MKSFNPGFLLLLISLMLVAGCDAFTDPATRLAFAIEAGANRLGSAEGSEYSIQGLTPVRSGERNGPYRVQLDKVGALIVWCDDDAGKVIVSGSTSYHSRFVTTPKTYIVDKPAGSTLTIDLERHNGKPVIVDVN